MQRSDLRYCWNLEKIAFGNSTIETIKSKPAEKLDNVKRWNKK